MSALIYDYQYVLVEAMKKLEKHKCILVDSINVTTNVGILSEGIGRGKTRTMCELIKQSNDSPTLNVNPIDMILKSYSDYNKDNHGITAVHCNTYKGESLLKSLTDLGITAVNNVRYNVVKPYISIVGPKYNPYYSKNIILVDSLFARDDLPARVYKNITIIICNQSILGQWHSELLSAEIDVYVIDRKKKIPAMPDTGVVLCTHTMFKVYNKINPYASFNRVVLDEPDTTHIPATNPFFCNFMWLVTATASNLRSRGYSYLACMYATIWKYTDCISLSSNVLKNGVYIGQKYVDYSTILDKCTIPYNAVEFNLDPVIEQEYILETPEELKIVQESVSSSVLDMINAGDVSGAIAKMGGQITDNLVEASLAYLHAKIDKYTNTIASTEYDGVVKTMKTKIKKIKHKILLITQRIEENLQSNCSICMDDIVIPTTLLCCNAIFCSECILSWTSAKGTCPMCRADIYEGGILCKHTDEPKDEPEMVESVETKDKMDILLDIVSKGGKFLVFASFQGSIQKINYALADYKCKVFQGMASVRTKHMSQLKNGDIDVLICNSADKCAGTNMPFVTDVIMFHKMNNSLRKQCIGRAQRVGRTNQLNVHTILYDNEV